MRPGNCSLMEFMWEGLATMVVQAGDERGMRRSRVAWMREQRFIVRLSKDRDFAILEGVRAETSIS